MRKDITITAVGRPARGKNEARRLRVKGLTPAIVYGVGKDPVAVAVSPKEVNKILHSATGHNTIFNVAVQDGESEPVMIVDWQHDPVKGNLLHVDLKRIDLAKRIVVKVPITAIGDAKGVKLQGGLLELITREIEIECLPDDIPDKFVIDVGELMIGQAKRASDVPMTGSMSLLSAPEQVLAHVVALRAEAVAADAEAAATAEPEVVKKGKKDEEAPAADKKKK
jgi:large subunit ribosomal protein L25